MTTPKRDPIIAVLNYFETVALPQAELAFALVRETLRKRRLPKTSAPHDTPAAPRKSNNPSGKKKPVAAAPAPLPS